MVDVKHLKVTIDTAIGTRARIDNPMGTTFDLAYVAVPRSGVELVASPFLRAWSEATEQMFADLRGVWLVSTEAKIELYVGSGSRAAVGGAFGHLDNEAVDMSVFFGLSSGLVGTEPVSLHLTLISMD